MLKTLEMLNDSEDVCNEPLIKQTGWVTGCKRTLETQSVTLPRVSVFSPGESSCDSSGPCTPASLRSLRSLRSPAGTPLRRKLHSIAQLLHQHHIQSYNPSFYKCHSGKLWNSCFQVGLISIVQVDPPLAVAFLFCLLGCLIADLDDASHTDENEAMEAERQSGSALDVSEYRRKRRLGTETDSEEDDEEELRSLDEFPVETTYVEQQEEEFGSVGSLSVIFKCIIYWY